MPAKFKYIDQYRKLANDLEQQSLDDLLSFDQESRNIFEEMDLKTEIKQEAAEPQTDILCMADSVISNSNSDTNNNNKSFHNFLNIDNSKNIAVISSQGRVTPVSTSSQTTKTTSKLTLMPTPFSLSSTSLPILSPFSTTTSTFSMTPNVSTTKTSSFVTELAGSGCTVVSNDFLLDSSSMITPLDGQDVCLEYTDLDKPFYGDYESYGDSIMIKPGALSDESNSVPLEEAVNIMTGTIHSDCNNLKIPYDPQAWDPDHVMRWVSWVCEKNHVPNVSSCFSQCDGHTLSSFTHDALNEAFGESGIKISNELELWKAAVCYFPEFRESAIDYHSSSQYPCVPHLDSLESFSFTTCISPAPSTCSSTHDTNSTTSTHSDHSDDESGYGSQLSSYSASSKVIEAKDSNRISPKVPTGRGHKQTIHLWQFLRELLLSQDNKYSDCIRWLDPKAGVFKIEDSKKVAYLWGAKKNRPAMNYDKLSRSVRQYYKKGIIKKTEHSKRLVYQFCANYL